MLFDVIALAIKHLAITHDYYVLEMKRVELKTELWILFNFNLIVFKCRQAHVVSICCTEHSSRLYIFIIAILFF